MASERPPQLECFVGQSTLGGFGPRLWPAGLATTFGSHFWRPLLAPTFGDHFWCSLLAPTLGACFWRAGLAPTFGSAFGRTVPVWIGAHSALDDPIGQKWRAASRCASPPQDARRRKAMFLGERGGEGGPDVGRDGKDWRSLGGQRCFQGQIPMRSAGALVSSMAVHAQPAA